MAPTAPLLAARNTTDANTGLSPTIIAGIVLAALIGAGAALWLAIHWYRKRASARRTARRASAFARFSPSASASDNNEKSPFPSAAPGGGTFSRAQINSTIVLPDRAVLRPGASPDEILAHYATQGTLPRPFAPFHAHAHAQLEAEGESPRASAEYSTAADADAGADASLDSRLPSGRPASTASWIPPSIPLAGTRSAPSRASTASSLFSFPASPSPTPTLSGGGGAQHKVRQLFDPVLPDELVLALGETLTLVQAFDDGWCVVARPSLFRPGDVELGAVPAWAFVRPVKGLRAERPMRLASLGVTVAPPRAGAATGIREDVMSWSNF